MILFREHRGGLKESMETLREFKDIEEMYDYVIENNKDLINERNVVMSMYFDKVDTRTWFRKTFIIEIEGHNGVLGYFATKDIGEDISDEKIDEMALEYANNVIDNLEEPFKDKDIEEASWFGLQDGFKEGFKKGRQ